MAGIVAKLERRDQQVQDRRRKRYLAGLICLVFAWIGLRLVPSDLKNNIMTGWGKFPSGVFGAWNTRTSDATLLAGKLEADKNNKKRSKKRRSRKRRHRSKRPKLKAPRYMRDALRDSPRAPRSWESVSKTTPRKKTKRRRRTRTKKKKTQHSSRGTSTRRRFSIKKEQAKKIPRARARPRPKPRRKTTARKQRRIRVVSPKKPPSIRFDGRAIRGGRRKRGKRLAYRLPNSSIGRLPDFYKSKAKKRPPPKKKKAKVKKPATPTVAKLLGTRSLRPPPPNTSKRAPSFSGLKKAFPNSLPDGKPFNRSTPSPEHVESITPPNEHDLYERWLEIDEHKNRKKDQAHWHGDGKSILYMHYGTVWASPKKARWSWIVKRGTKWWTIADGAQRMVRHKNLWWWKTEFGWFPLVEGKALAAAFAVDWKRKGLLTKGSTLKFSQDMTRVAVTTPKKGTTVFDARTGQYVGTVPQKARIAP